MLRCLALSPTQEPASRPFCNCLSHRQLQQGRCSYHILQPRSKGGYMSKLALLATLLVLGSTAVHAQTYNLPSSSTFLCDAESYDGQIVCRGIPLEDSKGTASGLFYIFSF